MNIHEAIEQARYYNGVRHTEETYFDVGAPHDIVVSNSAASRINPDEGGSFLRFEQYFQEEEEKATVNHLEKGRILHRYIKDARNFAVADENKPSDTICEIIEMTLAETRSDLPAPAGLITVFDQLKDTIIQAARVKKWNKTWGDDAVFRNLKKDGEGYLNFLIENMGKIILSKDVKESVDGMKLSIESSDCREYLLDNHEGVYYKELPIFWEHQTKHGNISCKSLLDNLEVDEEHRMLIITDLKTTSKPVSQFMGYTRMGLNPIEGNPTRIHMDGPFQYFRIYRQLASYGMALKEGVLSKMPDGGQWSISYRVVAVESKAPFELEEFTPRPIWMRYGTDEYLSCLDQVEALLRQKEVLD